MYIRLRHVRNIMASEKLRSDLARLKQLVAVCEYDVDNLCSGTKAAATRSRAKLMAISKLCASMRKCCMDVKNDIPSKSRSKKVPEVEDSVADIEEMPEPLVLQRETTSTSPEGVKSVKKVRKPRKPRAKKAV